MICILLQLTIISDCTCLQEDAERWSLCLRSPPSMPKVKAAHAASARLSVLKCPFESFGGGKNGCRNTYQITFIH
jgi:hypothetical protein